MHLSTRCLLTLWLCLGFLAAGSAHAADYETDPAKVLVGAKVADIPARERQAVRDALRAGDVITACNGREIVADWQVYLAMADSPSTSTVKLSIVRRQTEKKEVSIPGGRWRVSTEDFGDVPWKRWLQNTKRRPELDALVWKGYKALADGNVMEAGKALESAWEKGAREPTLALRLGIACDATLPGSDNARAIQVLERSEELYRAALSMAEDGLAFGETALVHAQFGRHAAMSDARGPARAAFTRAIAMGGRDPRVVLTLWQTFLDYGWEEERAKLVERLAKDELLNPTILFNLGREEPTAGLKSKLFSAYARRLGGDTLGLLHLAMAEAELDANKALGTLEIVRTRYDKDLSPSGKAIYHQARLVALAAKREVKDAEAEFMSCMGWIPYLDSKPAYDMYRALSKSGEPDVAARYVAVGQSLTFFESRAPGSKGPDWGAAADEIQKRLKPGRWAECKKEAAGVMKRVLARRDELLGQRKTATR